MILTVKEVECEDTLVTYLWPVNLEDAHFRYECEMCLGYLVSPLHWYETDLRI